MKMKRFFGRISRIYNKIIHSNLFLTVVSLFLGIIVWFSIINIVNPENETEVRIPVQINMEGSIPEHYNLAVIQNFETLYTTVKVKGPRTNIFTFNSNEITAELNLSSVTAAGGYSLNIDVKSSDDNLEIVSVEPSSVFLEFDRFVTKTMDIETDFEGQLEDGYVMTSEQVYPHTVDITGPQTVLNNIKRVYIPVNIAGRTEGATSTANIVIENENETLADRNLLTLSAEKVSYSYEIYFTKTIPVTVESKNNISGDETGYYKLTISPDKVTVIGNKNILDQMDEVKLETPIALESVTGKTQNYVFNLPENENYFYPQNSETTASVTVAFDSSVTTRVYTLSKSSINAFSFKNLPNGKTARIQTSSVQIPIRSLPSYLNMITIGDISGTIDFSQTNDKGQYLVEISVNEDVPYGITQRTYVDVELS